MKRVLVVAGTPGVGKTSVSTMLASRLQGMSIDLNELVRREGLDCGFDKRRETLIADTPKIAKRVREIIARVHSESYVVVDGHFAMDVVAADDVFLALILRRNPDELREALEEREFKEKKVTENVAAEVLDVCLFDALIAYGEKKVCEVDVSGRNVEEVVNEIIQVVTGRRQCRVGVVDWLTKLEVEGRLEDFLHDL